MLPSPPDLSPTLIAFLLSNCKYTIGVVTRCLRTLADEGTLRFETGTDGIPMISFAANAPSSGRSLLPFEEIVLGRARTLTAGRPSTPLSVLISDDGEAFGNWVEQLTDALGEAARQADLAKRSPGKWRLTSKGASAVDWWRQHGGVPESVPPLQDRRPADARPADARPAPFASGAAISPGATPLPRGQAWSSLGGQWHPVRVGQLIEPRRWGSLRTLWVLIFCTLLVTIWSVHLDIGSIPDVGKATGELITVSPLALGGIVILGAWLPVYLRRRRPSGSVTFRGEVIMQRIDKSEDRPARHILSIDDGTSPQSMTFLVSAAQYKRVRVRYPVLVTHNQRLRRLEEIEVAPRPSPPPSPTIPNWPN